MPALRSVSLILCLVCLSITASATELRVADFGALPDDGKDDGAAIREALKEARTVENPILVFEPGRYDFVPTQDATEGLIDVRDFSNLSIEGDGAELVGQGLQRLFLFRRCTDISISDLKVDWDPLPFTAGVVVASTDTYCDVRVAPGHPALEEPVESLFAVDADSKAFTQSGQPEDFRLGQRGYAKPAEEVSPGVLRIYRMPEPHSFSAGRGQGLMPVKGTPVIAYFNVRGGGAFQMFSCKNITLRDVDVYSAPGMAFMINNSEPGGVVFLEHCRVMSKPDRWKSVTADGMHFNMNRGKIAVMDCLIEDVGDDGFNVHAAYSMVHERVGDETLVVRGWMNPFVNPGMENHFKAPVGQFRVDDVLEFSSAEHRHVPAFEARIVAVSDVTVDGQTLKRVKLDRPLPEFVQEGIIIANASEVAMFLLRGTVVRRVRGQGIRIKTRNALVENCTFEDIQGNGVWIFCDADYGHESIATRNVTIRSTTFRNAVRAIRSGAGRQEPYDADVHQGIVIEGCTVSDCGPTPIILYSAKDVLIRDNTFEINGNHPVETQFSSDVRVEDNTIIPPAE